MTNLPTHWGHWLLTGLMTTALVACAGSTTPEISRTEDPAASENTATATAAGDAIKIGALMPMTGDLQAFGETCLNGVNLAVEEINAAGGVLGQPLIIAVGDTQTAAQPSIDAAQKLVSLENVAAIVGALSSGNTIPGAESITKSNQVPLISPASTSPVITSLADDDFLFRTVPSDAFQGLALAEVSREQGLENVAIIFINSDYG